MISIIIVGTFQEIYFGIQNMVHGPEWNMRLETGLIKMVNQAMLTEYPLFSITISKQNQKPLCFINLT